MISLIQFKGLDRETFSQRMGALYADLDYLHPFNEGNSRTLRTFTAQLAREAGHELDWNTKSVDQKSRDQLYIARDIAVFQRKYPGIGPERAERTNDLLEYEAYERVISPFKEWPKLSEIIKNSVKLEHDLKMARAFAHLTEDQAVKHFPQLQGAYNSMRSFQAEQLAEGKSGEVVTAALWKIREQLADVIETGKLHTQDKHIDQTQAMDR